MIMFMLVHSALTNVNRLIISSCSYRMLNEFLLLSVTSFFFFVISILGVIKFILLGARFV